MLAIIAVCLAIPTFGLSLVALVAPKLFLATVGVGHKAVCCAALGVLGSTKAAEGEDVDFDKGEFETTMRSGMKAIVGEQRKFRSQIEKVTVDLDRADKEVKAALEELTKVKNQTNASWEEVMKKMEKVQKQIALNVRSSFKDPIKRFLSSDENRFAINALAKYIISLGKDSPISKLDPAFAKYVEESNAKTKALTGVDAGLGQATVPIETFNEIYDLLLEFGDWSTLGVERVGARTVVYPLMTARPQFFWIGSQSTLAEGSQITSGAFGGGEVMLIVNTLAVLMYISRELLQDSTVDLAPYTIRQMMQSVAQGMDTAAFISTGNQDTTNAGYVGIFNAPLANSLLAAVAGAGHTSMGALTLEDFVQCTFQVSAEVLKRNPKWWAHPQIIAKAALIRDKMGRPLFQTFTEVPMAGIGSIMGFPVHPTAIAPSTDAPAQPVFTFGDPEGQKVGLRQDLELATSSDIGFPQNLMAYRTLMRAGVKMLTQPNSTTLKPYAVLQTSPQ